jgi:hypothetical protein
MCSIQRNGKKRPFCSIGSTEIFGNLSVVLGYRKIRCCCKDPCPLSPGTQEMIAIHGQTNTSAVVPWAAFATWLPADTALSFSPLCLLQVLHLT